jgi:hypothetical protein
VARGCSICAITEGVRGGGLFETDEEFFAHLEHDHHIPVKRPGETEEGAVARFKRENPEAGGPNCKCPNCRVIRARRGNGQN